jgi:prophage regulatory protein
MTTLKKVSIELLPSVTARTGLAKTTLYMLIKQNKFPKQVRISEKRIGFLSSEVDEWINQKVEESRGEVGAL